jgi:hypothetical protein
LVYRFRLRRFDFGCAGSTARSAEVHVQPKPRLTLLGGFELDAIGPAEPPSLPRKAKALLAFLALQPGRPQSRDKLATLLLGGERADPGSTEPAPGILGLAQGTAGRGIARRG